MKVLGWVCFVLGIIIAIGAIVKVIAGWNLGILPVLVAPLISWRGWIASHPKSKFSFCTYCGLPNTPNYKFCGNCGVQIKR